MSSAPGWYPDPYGAAGLRWWDGVQWTQHVNAAPSLSLYRPASRRPLPDGTPVYTVWIWLVTLLPLVQMLGVFTYRPFDGYTRMLADPAHPVIPDAVTLLGGPVFLIATAVSWLLLAVTAVFAWLDARELSRRGLERPFHWAWSLLAPIVYVIGRSVVVRRVAAGRGAAPITVSIVVYVVGFVVTAVWVLIMMGALLQSIGSAATPLGA